MRLHAANDDRAAALNVYHTCVTALERELDVPPGAETVDAYRRLLDLEDKGATAPLHSSHTHLVGRRAEWQSLQRVWADVQHDGMHCVAISGEAGIGKTRLADEMLHWARQQGITTAATRAYAAGGSLAYAPLVDLLRSEALRPRVAQLPAIWRSELARLLPELLVENPELPPPEALTERWQVQRLYDAVGRVLLRPDQPLILLLDDLQWFDGESIAWLLYFLRPDQHVAANAHASPRLLVLTTLRPEEIDQEHAVARLLLDFQRGDHLTELALAPLSAAETAELSDQVADRRLDAATAAAIHRATEGNPLFVVETVRAGLTTTSSPEMASAPLIAPKVQAVIRARLAQLSPAARELAGLAAVMGRSFSYAALALAVDRDEDSVVRSLDELWRRRIIRERGVGGYDFSHDRIRDVAYVELSSARRRLLHRRVAEALEVVHADQVDAVCAQLAFHYEEAGLVARAISCYGRAAAWARRLAAYAEAVTHLQRRLALLNSLAVTPEQIEQRVDNLLELGSALFQAKGFSTVDAEEIYSQARTLCRHIENAGKRFLVLRGLFIFWEHRCRWQIAAELGDEMLRLAAMTNDPLHWQDALRLTGAIFFHQGRFQEAHGYFVRAVAHNRPEQHLSYTLQYDHDPGVANLTRLAANLWFLGYADQAQQRMQEAICLCRNFNRPFDLFIALSWAFDLGCYLRQRAAARAAAMELVAIKASQPGSFFITDEMFSRGWLLAEQGEADEGLRLMRQCLEVQLPTGDVLLRTYQLGVLAETYVKAGRLADGLALLDDIPALMEGIGEHFWGAELHRLKGDLLREQGATVGEIEACYLEAIAIARQQGARSFELRSATSLARLWQAQGRRADAHDLLAPVYAWFSEGFETPDLQEARTLLEELSS
jgi:tetratricopeptide (TPR) repeat protein